MKKYIIISIIALVSSINLYAQDVVPTSSENYILTQAPQVAKTTLGNNNTPGEVLSTVTYYDGLGRPIQSVGVGQGGGGKDIITPVVYDEFGRTTQEYLPYATTGTNGSFRSNALSAVASFYNTAAFNYSTQPYTQSVMEYHPLNRVEEVSHPGKSSDGWTSGGAHTDKMEYSSNAANEVKKYSDAGTTVVINGYYDAGTLTVTVSKDANWTSGNNHTTRTYTDLLGRVILTRSYVDNAEVNTYNVYDDYGNLKFVLNPVASDASSITTTVLNASVFQYRYDEKNRLIEKKIPGKGWEYIVYDKLDRVAFTQDANLDGLNQWNFTKYDALDRVAYSGIYASTASRVHLQDTLNNRTTFNESRRSNLSAGGTTINYTNNIWPTSGITIQSQQYYDDYNVNGAPAIVASYGVTPEAFVKGLPTVTRTKMLESSIWLTSATYYDNKGRTIQSYETHITGGWTWTDLQLDWAGKVEETTTRHKRLSSDAYTTVVNDMEYDEIGRPVSETMQINGGNEELISKNYYDDLGRLEQKDVGNTIASPLQKIDYSYNIRGWMTDINNVDIGTGSENDLFGMKLLYNSGTLWNSVAQWNGNISGVRFRVNNNTREQQAFRYDELGRIEHLYSSQLSSAGSVVNTNRYQTTITYSNKVGDIGSIVRKGALTSGYGIIDNMSYTYNSSGQLNKIIESSNLTLGFSSKNHDGTFLYDGNGNMTRDNHKKMDIAYNQLNLPKQFDIDNEGTIDIHYDASGRKHKKTTSSSVNQEYLGMFEYKGGVLDAIYHAEGRAVKTGSSFTYEYNIKDHLGNTRVTFKKNGSSAVLLDEHHYYAFGMEMEGFNGGTGSDNQYLYNGKEMNTDFGLDMLDYGARWYDPSIARFHNIDPLAEDYSFQNPFAYAANNPIKFIDYMGMGPTDKIDVDKKTGIVTITEAVGDDVVNLVDDGKVIDSYTYGSNGSFSEDATFVSQEDGDQQIEFTNPEKANEFYEFSAKSDVEVGLVDYEDYVGETRTIVATSSDPDKVANIPGVVKRLSRTGGVGERQSHSQPDSNPPSGYFLDDPKMGAWSGHPVPQSYNEYSRGDAQNARQTSKLKGMGKMKFELFSVKSNSIITYDGKTKYKTRPAN